MEITWIAWAAWRDQPLASLVAVLSGLGLAVVLLKPARLSGTPRRRNPDAPGANACD
jgi:hypothetical protein